MTNHELASLVRESSPPPEFPVSFDRSVWQSIAVRENRKLSTQMSRFFTERLQWLLRPAGALASITLMLLLGAGLGGLASAKQNEDLLRAAYTTSINPILSAHTASKP